MTRDREAGVVLINVLVLLSLSATVVYMMLSLADLSIARSQRFSAAGAALALVSAGEASAIVALRRDMVEAPDADYAAEPWGLVAQRPVGIPGGVLEIALADAQGRFNLNIVKGADLQATETLEALVAALELPPATAARIAATVDADGPLLRLEDLGWRAGVPSRDIARLAEFATALPGSGAVNLNAAPLELMAVLLQNPVRARVLGSIRARNGFLTPEDLEAARVVLPPGAGFRSDLFTLRVTARIDAVTVTMESLLQRRPGLGGAPEVAVIERRNVTTAAQAPPPSS